MPMVRIAGLLIYFAHVPKCGGSAVERYLKHRFGTLALQDGRFTLDADQPRWSRTSPQHIDAAALERVVPFSFFDGGFAVVRHPVARLRSVFRFQRDVESAIPAGMGLADWMDELPQRRRADPYALDNHPRPMTEMVPEGCSVFRLEDGLQPVVAWLDEVAGADDGPREIARVNDYTDKLASLGLEPGPEPVLSADVQARIAEIYAADYERFGYAQSWQEPKAVVAAD